LKTPILAAALLAVPLAATTAEPADPAAAVPRVEYRSVFQGTPRGVEEETLDWKKANADVAGFPRGHIDLLKWEESQAGASAPAATPAQPAASVPARPQAPRGHQH
jgi:hypothetical protein